MAGVPRWPFQLARRLEPYAMYPLRLGLAAVFLFTGVEKLAETEANAGITAAAGIPWPYVSTRIIGVGECLAAAAFIAGVGVRTAAASMSVLLVAVIATLKVPGSFWSDGWGIDVAVLAGTVTLWLAGPGRPRLHIRKGGRATADAGSPQSDARGTFPSDGP